MEDFPDIALLSAQMQETVTSLAKQMGDSLLKRQAELEGHAQRQREDLATQRVAFEEEVRARKVELEAMADQLAAEKKLFESEKAAVTALFPKKGEVIELNVGGRIFTANRATLLTGGSVLEAVFSGRWDDSMTTDSVGRVFLDLDSDCFAALLHHLQMAQLESKPLHFACIDPPEGKSKFFSVMMHFLNLSFVLERVPQRFAICSQSMSLLSGGRAVQHCGSYVTSAHATGEQVMDSGKFLWAFRVHRLCCGTLLGIIANTAPADASFLDATCHGWGAYSRVWAGGHDQPGPDGWQGFREGDVAAMQLDLDAGQLRMKVERLGEQLLVLDVPQDSYRLHVYLGHGGDHVEVLDIDSLRGWTPFGQPSLDPEPTG